MIKHQMFYLVIFFSSYSVLFMFRKPYVEVCFSQFVFHIFLFCGVLCPTDGKITEIF